MEKETCVMNSADFQKEFGQASKSLVMEILTIGTGVGATGVYGDEPCSSIVLLVNNQPKLLVDAGFGVTKEFYRQFSKEMRIPSVYLTKSHASQTAELPVILQVENDKRQKKMEESFKIFCHNDIKEKLTQKLEEYELSHSAWVDVPEIDVGNNNNNDKIKLTEEISFNCLSDQKGCYSLLVYYLDSPLFSYSGEFHYSPELFRRLVSLNPTVILSAQKHSPNQHWNFEEAEKVILRESTMNVNFFITSYGKQSVKYDPSPPLVPLRPGRKYLLPVPKIGKSNDEINILNSQGYNRCNTTQGILGELRRWNEENTLILFIGDELSGVGWTSEGKLAAPSISNLIKEIIEESKKKLQEYNLNYTQLDHIINYKMKHLRTLHQYLNEDEIREKTEDDSVLFIEDILRILNLKYSKNGTPLRHRLCYIIDDLKLPFVLTSNFDTFSISSDLEIENCWFTRQRFSRVFLTESKTLAQKMENINKLNNDNDNNNKLDNNNNNNNNMEIEKIDIKSENKRIIFMLRGNWRQPQSMISHLDDPDEKEERKLISECLKKYHVLFIGCSMSQCKNILNMATPGGIRQPIAFIENNQFSDQPPSILYSTNPSSSASLMLQYINENQLVDYLNLICCGVDPSVTKADSNFPSNDFGVYYYTYQRALYLHQQLAVEKVADRVSFLTPNLTNSICTANYIDTVCKKNLKEKFLEKMEMNKEQLEQTLYFMKERGINLLYLLKNGKKIRIAFSRINLDRTLFTHSKSITASSPHHSSADSNNSLNSSNSNMDSHLQSEYTEALLGQFHANPDGIEDYNRYLLLLQMIAKYPKLIELRIVNRELSNEESFALIEFEVPYPVNVPNNNNQIINNNNNNQHNQNNIGKERKKIAAAYANQATIDANKTSPSSVFYVCNQSSLATFDKSNPVKRFASIWEESSKLSYYYSDNSQLYEVNLSIRDEFMWMHNKSVRYLHRLVCKYAAERVQVDPIELKYDPGEEITSLGKSSNPKIAYYRIEMFQNKTHILGKGGFGKVYYGGAFDSSNNLIMNVAIKVPKFKNRFEFNYSIESLAREADGLSRCDSPNIVKLIEFVQLLPTESHLITEFLEGESLQSILDRETIIPIHLLREIALQALNGLQTLHGENIIHFDLSPANLFITNYSQANMIVKIIDLGIARVMGRDSVHPTGVGTPRYREEYSRSKANLEADLRILAIVLHDCLFGTDLTLQFKGDHLFDPAKYPSEFPFPFFQKAFNKQYSSAKDMIYDLNNTSITGGKRGRDSLDLDDVEFKRIKLDSSVAIDI